jgi:hypothetical protein
MNLGPSTYLAKYPAIRSRREVEKLAVRVWFSANEAEEG